MGVHIRDKKLVITTRQKTFHFDLPKDIDNNLKYKIETIIKHYEFLAEYKIKIRLGNYCPNIGMKTIFMNTENSKINEPN